MEEQMGEGARSILDLPSDVLLRVLNEVDLFQQGAAILTCRKFKELLYANTLRTTLDLSIAPDLDITYCFRLTRASLAQIKTKAATLRRLAIGWNTRLDSSVLTEILCGLPDPTKTFFFSAVQEKSGCPRLERLDLRGCWNLEDTEAISLCCPALTHANFDYCPFTEVALANFVNSQGAKLKELSIWWTDNAERPPGCTLPPRYSKINFPPHVKVYSEHSPPTTFAFEYDVPFPQQIEAATEQAQAEDKRILLHVALERGLPGGDTFTRRLHNFFTTNREIARSLNESYVYLIVDNCVAEQHLRGLGISRALTEYPTLIILDKEANALVAKGTGDLEENCPSGCCYNAQKIFHFLRKWKPGALLPPASTLPDLKEVTSQAPINPLYSFNPFGGITSVMPAQNNDDY
ncbi:Fbox domain containing protein [Acanthamoeba castellanii str. Neff]|uniref:Fbox domain containing protein n=1 Tax=Acanthamoeba castellanii (strain ATCC 30010 / Neff) TaxID=1257118 RepID=L8GVZ0_ACACF|nr:Fbox domain containing protein [Acanthamoeba castellanii str. Neff]ELR17165.1 Fbox domain containing protein [Acanthamoeba castellanii str. Neff]